MPSARPLKLRRRWRMRTRQFGYDRRRRPRAERISADANRFDAPALDGSVQDTESKMRTAAMISMRCGTPHNRPMAMEVNSREWVSCKVMLPE